jgi:hypothetical protein
MHDHFQQHEVQILHQDKSGYVVRCRHCHGMQVTFNNLTIDQDKHEFESLARVVYSYWCEHQDKKGQKLRNIFVETPFEKFRLIFSYQELSNFHNMLQKVSLILRAENDCPN